MQKLNALLFIVFMLPILTFPIPTNPPHTAYPCVRFELAYAQHIRTLQLRHTALPIAFLLVHSSPMPSHVSSPTPHIPPAITAAIQHVCTSQTYVCYAQSILTERLVCRCTQTSRSALAQQGRGALGGEVAGALALLSNRVIVVLAHLCVEY
jgi:hypothetical protein